jgi:phosphoadenosine phosphosulfate reductase
VLLPVGAEKVAAGAVVDKFTEALQVMNGTALKSEGCLVFFSGGKDSLVVMDMATKIFKRVVGVFMYFIPGLIVVEKQLKYARKQWGVEIIQVPHWILFRTVKYGFYSFPVVKNENKIPDIKILDIYKYIMAQTGIDYIVTGAKATDSIWRKRNLHSTENYPFLLTPLRNWNKFDVLYYLNKNGIPVPDNEGGNATGVDLTTPLVCWLYDNHREDYEKMELFFPFVGAIIKRRELYGIGRKQPKK